MNIRLHYLQLGLIAYIEHKIKAYEAENFMKPSTIYLGALEWTEILQSHPARDLKIAGIQCVPMLSAPEMVDFE